MADFIYVLEGAETWPESTESVGPAQALGLMTITRPLFANLSLLLADPTLGGPTTLFTDLTLPRRSYHSTPMTKFLLLFARLFTATEWKNTSIGQTGHVHQKDPSLSLDSNSTMNP